MLKVTHITSTVGVAMAVITSYILWTTVSPREKRKRLRQKLPSDLEGWRLAGKGKIITIEEQIWTDLDEVLRDEGYLQWTYAGHSTLLSPGRTYPVSSGFGYAMPSRPNLKKVGCVAVLCQFDYMNGRVRAARTREGHDVVIRVAAIGNEGLNHLEVLRKIAFEDILFCVFPKVGESCSLMFGWWPKNSVGDILDMIMQMLEGLAFIHNLRIAHRDAFRDNFLVQWHPESLDTMKISPSRPRVYLTDFESAIQCPQDCPDGECRIIGYPFGDSAEALKIYARPHAPELTAQRPYDPFKLDIWQLGISLLDFKSTISPIDEILVAMTDTDFNTRLSANEAFTKLQTAIQSMAPESLLIKPMVIGDHYYSNWHT